jgi:stearoyl-CoA desaturase (delta-9 desaturase)
VGHPVFTTLSLFWNWCFWYQIFFVFGGHSLALVVIGMSLQWALAVRTFNYSGPGRGRNQKVQGIDFSPRDLAINQMWPGYAAGEWHSNHHLYPRGARSGFLAYQVDLPWLLLNLYCKLGSISRFFQKV